MFGDRRPYLTALLTIDPDEAGALAEKVGAASKEPADLAKDPAVRKELQGAVDDANRKFARIEQVKKFTILERDLSQEEEELTPTLKVKRNVVYERYKDEFKALYDAGDERPKSGPRREGPADARRGRRRCRAGENRVGAVRMLKAC